MYLKQGRIHSVFGVALGTPTVSPIVSSPGCKARISTGPACPASGGQFPALASRRPAAGIMNGWHTWAGAPGMIRCAKCGAAVHGRTRHECGLGNEVAEPVPVSVSPRSWPVRSPGPDQGSPLAREVMFRQHRQNVSADKKRGLRRNTSPSVLTPTVFTMCGTEAKSNGRMCETPPGPPGQPLPSPNLDASWKAPRRPGELSADADAADDDDTEPANGDKAELVNADQTNGGGDGWGGVVGPASSAPKSRSPLLISSESPASVTLASSHSSFRRLKISEHPVELAPEAEEGAQAEERIVKPREPLFVACQKLSTP